MIRGGVELLNRWLGGEEVYLRRRVSDRLWGWLQEFEPQIVYCHAASLGQVRLLQELRQGLRVPFCIHVMDDWANVIYRTGWLKRRLRDAFDTEFRQFLADCRERMTIGSEMSRAYTQRYGLPFKPFSNAINCSLWDAWARKRYEPGEPFTLVYIGIVDPKNQVSLGRMANCISARCAGGERIRFSIYTFPEDVSRCQKLFERGECVSVHVVPTTNPDMGALMSSADLLYFPLDFTPENIASMRYSIFAKLPTYMISGTPILASGPAEMAAIDYALREKWAYVVTEDSDASLQKAILNLFANAELRRSLAQCARAIARRDFDLCSIRSQFQAALVQMLQPTTTP
jgi:glycosyltransferase involved in cell wall biosynthesis